METDTVITQPTFLTSLNNAAGESAVFNLVRLLVKSEDKNWVAIAAGARHSVALKADGSLWGWGLNDHGQLGDGANADRVVPAKILADKEVW